MRVCLLLALLTSSCRAPEHAPTEAPAPDGAQADRAPVAPPAAGQHATAHDGAGHDGAGHDGAAAAEGEPIDPLLAYADPHAPRDMDPIAFLDHLVAGAQGDGGGFRGESTDEFPVAGWIEPHHMPLLIARLASETPALHVTQTKCSILPTGLSTEGLQAQFLLDAVRAGVYPPMLSSTFAQHGEPAAYEAWWQSLQRIEPLPLPTDGRGAIAWPDIAACDLLDLLCRHAGSAARLPAHPPYGWIKEADAGRLIERVDSERPCAALIVHRMPKQAPPPTTEGATARMLLHLYREAALRRHHAALGNPHDTEFEQDPDAWRSWWREWVERPKSGAR